MQVGVLGPLEVIEDGRRVPVNGTRTRTLLGVLALNPGRVVSRDRLVEELWGKHPPANAVNALQARVSQLRRLVGPRRLVGHWPGYLLDITPGAVDAVRFEVLGASGRAALGRGEVEEAAATLREALGLWRGPALVDVADLGDMTDGDVLAGEAARLEELRLAVLENRIEADLALGRQAEVTSELRALVAEHPLRERLWGQLMVALYRSERQADALAAYQQARRVLADELGLDPGPELQRVEAAILAQDPELVSSPIARGVARRSPALPGNLRPSLTSFVGRNEDCRRVRKLLGEARLVTLTGPGEYRSSSSGWVWPWPSSSTPPSCAPCWCRPP